MLAIQGGGRMISEDLELDSLTSSDGWIQIIGKQTHAVSSSLPCIDLIFVPA